MARKKKSAQTETGGDADGRAGSETGPSSSSSSSSGKRAQRTQPSTSSLIICRNKHWRYISSFHGPWLQLPPEVLESLAHTNYLAPRPRPIDAAVFYDLLKIRRHVDEATTLAVRATSGLTSAALNSSLGGNGGGGGGGGGTLSRERKHRMRELATSKLAAAYRLDEIAASVATMQSASTLEDVAQLVLQRSPGDVEAQYVHFFHEKIPSRMMAQCTPLDALDAVVAERPADGSALRTRALTRIFKDDYARSARDLTDALAAARYHAAAQHRDQLALAARPPDPKPKPRDWRTEPPLPDADQPSSLETQLLFHRAGVYLAMACRLVPAALDGLQAQEAAQAATAAHTAAGDEPAPETPDAAAARLARAESRRQLRQNAKRALRDYTAFLARFDYTPGLAPAAADDLLRRYHATDYQSKLDRLLQESATTTTTATATPSDALAPYKRPPAPAWPQLPPPPVFTLNQLFDSVPPAALPPFPPPPHAPPSPLPANESLTYHPLLPEALHSLLLVHALLQTPPKELLRHAHNAARLARLLDGYPIFLAARSPARSDWVEVLRRGGNWIGLVGSWERLCRPASEGGYASGSGNGHGGSGSGSGNGALTKKGGRAAGAGDGVGRDKAETKEQRRERQKHEAILEALADERVVDEASFQRAVRAREQRFRDDDKAEAALDASAASSPTSPALITEHAHAPAGTAPDNDPPDAAVPKRWAPSESKEYPIGTERAEAIARWVRDAPPLTSESNSGKKRRKKGSKKSSAPKGKTLDGRVEELDLADDGVEGDEVD